MGINVNDILAQDPQELQRQRYMQQVQQASQVSPFSQIGFALGRGVSNKMQGRGFFESNDPVLESVTNIRRIIQESTSNFDPKDPAATYETLAANLAQAGFGAQAAQAAAQARQFRMQDKEASMKEETLDINRQKLQLAIDQEKRQGRYTDAQIKKLEQGLGSGEIVQGRDQFGQTIFYEKKDGKLKVITPEGATATDTGTGSGKKSQAESAAEAYQRRLKSERQQSLRSSASNQPVAEIDPYGSGEVTYRNPSRTRLTPEERETLSRAELQEYNRTGKIPARLMGM
jgi:hypothetical protein